MKKTYSVFKLKGAPANKTNLVVIYGGIEIFIHKYTRFSGMSKHGNKYPGFVFLQKFEKLGTMLPRYKRRFSRKIYK